MSEHFPRSTVSASFWCGKCQKFTQHRIDDRRKGPCLDCIARLNVPRPQPEPDRQKSFWEDAS